MYILVVIIGRYGTSYLYTRIRKTALPFLILHLLKNKPIKIIYYLYQLSEFNQTIKDKISVDQYILKISERISLGYFVYSRQSFLNKIIYYFLIKSILKVVLGTIIKRSFSYFLDNFSINNFLNVIVANELETKLPLSVTIVEQSLSDISFKDNAPHNITILPQKIENSDRDSSIFFTNFLAKTSLIYIIEHFILRKHIKFYIAQKFAVIFTVVFGKDIIRLLYSAVIYLTTEIEIPDYIIKFLSNFINIKKTIKNIKTCVRASKNGIILASASLGVALKEYPLVDNVIQYLSEPSDIDWILILSNSHNIVKKNIQLLGVSLDVVLKEYPLVDNVIQYLSEPSDIDWISILSNSHNILRKNMQLVGASLAVILEESPYVPEDITIVGDVINTPFFKKVSLISLDAVIQTNTPFVLQKTSGVVCSYLYDNIHDDIF